jgi:hypothetical protein
MLIDNWLYLELYFSTEYHNSSQSIIFLFWKYLADIRSEARLNLFWEFINGNCFALTSQTSNHILQDLWLGANYFWRMVFQNQKVQKPMHLKLNNEQQIR